MIWKIVSDSSCDLKTTDFSSDLIGFETVPLKIQVGEHEFVDNDELDVPVMLTTTATAAARNRMALDMQNISTTVTQGPEVTVPS